MILMAVCLALGQTILEKPTLYEFPNPAAEAVAIQAIVPIPVLDLSRRTALEICLRTACIRTLNYGYRDIGAITLNGSGVLGELGVDHIRIGFQVAPSDLSRGLSLMRSVLCSPSFMQDSLTKTTNEFRLAEDSPWLSAIFSTSRNPVMVTSESALSLWRGLVNLNTVRIGVGGKLTPGSAQSAWEAQPDAWPVAPRGWEPPRFPGFAVKSSHRVPHIPGESVQIGTGTVISGDPKEIALAMVCVSVLGCGKESLLWRISREQLGFSYRQEAFLAPNFQGWVPIVAVGTDQKFVLSELKSALQSSIDGLTPADLDRARGIIKANLLEGMPIGPI